MMAHLEEAAWFGAGYISLGHAAIVNTENCSAVTLYFYLSHPPDSTSANWLPIASFINLKSHFNVHCPCDLHLLVWCLAASFGAGMTPMLAGSWELIYFSCWVLFCREAVRWCSPVPMHFLPLLLSPDNLRSDVSKLTTGFLCLLEAKLKLLVTSKNHSGLLLYYILTLFFFFFISCFH